VGVPPRTVMVDRVHHRAQEKCLRVDGNGVAAHESEHDAARAHHEPAVPAKRQHCAQSRHVVQRDRPRRIGLEELSDDLWGDAQCQGGIVMCAFVEVLAVVQDLVVLPELW
jgi:hypothetical protein